jgi:hypothetical protein
MQYTWNALLPPLIRVGVKQRKNPCAILFAKEWLLAAEID